MSRFTVGELFAFQYPMWVSFGFNFRGCIFDGCLFRVSVPYVGELRIQYHHSLCCQPWLKVSVPYVGELRIQLRQLVACTANGAVSVPYVGELRIQSAHLCPDSG